MNGDSRGPYDAHKGECTGLVRLRIDRVETVGNALRASTCDALLLAGSRAVELRPGMVIAGEPLFWGADVRGGGGVRSEDMGLVAEHEPLVMAGVDFDERPLD